MATEGIAQKKRPNWKRRACVIAASAAIGVFALVLIIRFIMASSYYHRAGIEAQSAEYGSPSAIRYYLKAADGYEKIGWRITLHRADALYLAGIEHDALSHYSEERSDYNDESEFLVHREEAIKCYREAQAIYQKIYLNNPKAKLPFGDAMHESLMSVNNKIAFICEQQGEYDEALDWYFPNLSISKKILDGEKDIEAFEHVAQAYCNIAAVYEKQDEFDEALEQYFKALTFYKEAFRWSYPVIADVKNNVADIYLKKGEYDKALEWCFKALLPPYSYQTFKSLNELGEYYIEQGEYDEALKWFFKALAASEKTLGKEHLSTAMAYEIIAMLYGEQEQYDVALWLYLKAYRVYSKVFGKDYSDAKKCRDNMRNDYKASGRIHPFDDWLAAQLAKN